MCIVVSYYKLGDSWYLDLPEYLEQGAASEGDLERIGAFRDFLELASEGKSSVKFQIDNQPSAGADVLELAGFTGGRSGAYYCIKQFREKKVDLELWFNQVIYHFVDMPPEKLYIKELIHSSQ